jgi:dephospho-CoA kinase
MSLRIGLTGGIGCGKSAVAELLAEHGALVIDADRLAREVVAVGTPGLAEVVSEFGAEMLTERGELDRAALGRIVFSDPGARSRLEAIVHPRVRARAVEIEATASRGTPIVHVIPLLVETGQHDAFDLVLVVDADPAVQLARVQSRDQVGEAEALARIGAQASRDQRLAVADVVIENNGSVAELAAVVDRFWATWGCPLRFKTTDIGTP